MSAKRAIPLYRLHEPAFRTQYSEVKERANAAGALLAGTPGTLYERSGTGRDYWYRVYYPFPGRQAEEFVAAAEGIAAHGAMRDRIAHAAWTVEQVKNLRRLGYQVADRGVASVLVQLYNRRLFEAGLVVVGTVAYMCWLNEYGARAVAGRTQDIGLACRQRLKLATPISFLASLQATQLPFVTVPGMPSHTPATSLKLPGREGLRVDLLAPGTMGQTVEVPELQWHAQAIPHYDYLLDGSQAAVMLAGGHCIPIQLPRVERMTWYKLYSSSQRTGSADKAEKDIVQAATLAAILVEQEGASLPQSFADAPFPLPAAVLSRLPRLESLLEAHPETLAALRSLHPAISLQPPQGE